MAGSEFIGGRYRSELDNGLPNASGQLWPSSSGTSTFQTTYVDAALTTPNTFQSDGFGGLYILLDARGEAEVWMGPDAYRFTEKTAAGVLISTTDGVQSIDGKIAAYVTGAIGAIPPAATIPPGTIFDYAGAGVPTGFLACTGAEFSRTAYAALFAVIGTTYGPGNGSTTANLPDFRRRVSVGVGGASSPILGSALGNTGGEETHLQLTAEVGTHTHLITDPGHTHGGGEFRELNLIDGSRQAYVRKVGDALDNATDAATTGITISANSVGTPFNIVQPSLVVGKIIKI